MSFIQSKNNAGYAPGYFLASAECERQTIQVAQNHAAVVTTADGGKYVPAGAVIPANGGSAKGILYEDVDVTTGAMPGSIVTKGTIYEDRLPASLASAAKTAMPGITVIASTPAADRPDFGPGELAEIAVVSAAGTAAGDTALTITYTQGSGESYLYKTDSSKAPEIGYNAIPDYSWTPWDGSSDITATTGHKITVVSVDANGRAVAAGNATVTSKA